MVIWTCSELHSRVWFIFVSYIHEIIYTFIFFYLGMEIYTPLKEHSMCGIRKC